MSDDGGVSLASLALVIDSTQVPAGVDRLNDLAEAGGKAEGAARRLTAADKELADETRRLTQAAAAAGAAHDDATASLLREAKAVQDAARSYADFYDEAQRDFATQYTRQLGGLEKAHVAGGKAAKLQSYELLNLSRNLADVGVQAAMGTNALMIAVMQGPQILDVFQSASQRGVTFGAALRGIAASAAPVAIALAPLIALAGAAAAAFGLMHRELAKDYPKNVTDGLGLTEDQLDRVKHKTVTMGDTFAATVDVMGKYLRQGPLGEALDWFDKRWNETLDGVAAAAFDSTANIIGAFIGGYRAIELNWRSFPAVLGDVFTMAANAAIGAIERMVNASIKGLNALFDVLRGLPQYSWLPNVSEVDLSKYMGDVTSAAQFTGKAFGASIKQAQDEVRAGMRRIGADIKSDALKSARDQARKEAGDPRKGPAPSKSDAEREYERAFKQVTRATEAAEGELAARRILNAEVAAGGKTMAEATRALELENAIRPYTIAAAKAEGKERDALLGLVERLKNAYAGLTDEKLRSDLLGANDARGQRIEVLRKELALVGANNRDREVELAGLRAEQELRAKGYRADRATPDQRAAANAYVAGARTEAGLGADVKRDTENYNNSLNYTLDLLSQISDHARDAAGKFSRAFDGMGEGAQRAAGAIGDLVGTYADLGRQEESIRRTREEQQKNQTKGSEAWMHAEVLAARESKKARVSAYGDMAAAGRSFFEEGSAGYKVMQAAEIAFRTVELAMSIRAMAQQGVETAAKVGAVATEVGATAAGEVAKNAFTAAGTAVRTPMKVAEGAASMFASLGPLGFVAVGGMLAVMAGLGFSGGGRGSAPGAGDMEARQKAQGTGSVLGDSKAKSDSIARSLEVVAANSNKDLEFSNGMLKALRSIDSGIGALSAAVARSLSTGGALDTSGLNLGKTSTGPGALTRIFAPISNLLPGLFGSRTTRTLQDQGLQFGSQSLSDILSGGIQGQTYAQVLENTQKKFLGLTYSNKDRVTTTTGALDADLSKQITDVIGSLRSGVLEAASVLGVTGAQATLDAFQVSLGKLSFKDLSGAEIKEALNAIFGKLGDDLAATAIPELTALQKVGEGAFETLSRVARQYQVVDVSLKSIGMTFGAVGVSSLKARERLVDLAGGIDEFADQVRSFAETYLTDVERMAPIQRAVAEELARLNLTSVKTKDQFKNIVLGLDLTTEAGAQMYAALMALAPAFAKVIDFQTEGSKAVQDARDAVQAAYDRETEAAERMRDKFLDLAKSMRDLDKDLEALMDRTPAEAANRSADEFASILQKARSGDADAMGQLAGVTQNYAEALKGSARSRLEYDLGLAAARDGVRATEQAANRQVGVAEQQLATAKAMVAGILTVNDSVLSLAAAVANYRAAQQAQAVTPPPVTPKPTAPPPANDNPTPTPRAPDWDSYVQHYADVRAEGERLLATADRNSPWFKQHGLDKGVAGFGEWHWNNKGKGEGRTPYAAGGLMDRPITLGESGIGGEAGPEGILPLANVGGKMGVHAVMGREDSRQLAQMLGEMQRMNAALVAIARSNHEMNKNIRRILNEGISVHGAQPGDPVPTKTAA